MLFNLDNLPATNWSLILPALAAIFAVSRVLKYRQAVKVSCYLTVTQLANPWWKMTGGLPGFATPFQNMALPGM